MLFFYHISLKDKLLWTTPPPPPRMAMESPVKFCSPQNISGASQQNSVLLNGWSRWGLVFTKVLNNLKGKKKKRRSRFSFKIHKWSVCVCEDTAKPTHRRCLSVFLFQANSGCLWAYVLWVQPLTSKCLLSRCHPPHPSLKTKSTERPVCSAVCAVSPLKGTWITDWSRVSSLNFLVPGTTVQGTKGLPQPALVCISTTT